MALAWRVSPTAADGGGPTEASTAENQHALAIREGDDDLDDALRDAVAALRVKK